MNPHLEGGTPSALGEVCRNDGRCRSDESHGRVAMLAECWAGKGLCAHVGRHVRCGTVEEANNSVGYALA